MNETVKHSEITFQLMVESSPNALILVNKEGKIAFANQQTQKLFGYSRNELIGQNIEILIPPRFAKGHPTQRNMFFSSPEPRSMGAGRDLFALRKDNTEFPVEIGLNPVVTVDGTLVLAAIIDITERKKFEEKQALYASIVNSSDDAIISKDLNGVVTSWNKGAEKVFGYSPSEIIGKQISLLIPPRLRGEEIEILAKIKNGQNVDHYETERIRKDGQTIYASLTISPIKDLYGNIIGASKIARDITEREVAEESLRKSLKEVSDYKFALDEAAIVAITDQGGIINHVNENFCKISKYSRAELLGKDHRIINSGYHPKEFVRDLWVTIANGKIWRGELKNRAKDGTYYWVDTTIVPFLNEVGKPYQYLAIRADITQRKKAEEEIKALNENLEQKIIERTAQLQFANQELESFSYSVAHDLRSPLRGMHGYATMLKEDYGVLLDDEGQRLLGELEYNAKKMGSLIDDLLTFSKLSRKEINKSLIDMNELVNGLLIEISKSQPNSAIFKIEKLHPVTADAPLMKHVMTNLLSNAVKYSSKTEKPMIEIKSREENDMVIYSVKDNGVGFDMEFAGKLFGVFQRLHSDEEFEGTGVGLAIAQRIVNRHGGQIWAESTEGKGATFYFSLPGANSKT
jgi:PAS domain S-box-containing protein